MPLSLTLCIVASLTVAPVAATDSTVRAPHIVVDTVRPWRGSLTVAHATFGPSPSPWPAWRHLTATSYRTSPRGALGLEAHHVRRHGEMDGAMALDGYAVFGRRGYGNLRVQLAPGAQVLPRTHVWLEMFHNVGDGWEVSGVASRMRFAADRVDQFGGGIARYAGDWYLRTRGMALVRRGVLGGYGVASARRLIGASDEFVEVSGGGGRDVVLLGVGPVIDVRPNGFAAVRAQKFLWPSAGITGLLSIADQAAVPLRRTVAIGLLLRW